MLALLKWLPFLSKLSAISGWLSFIPGGQILGIIGSIFGLAASFVQWLLADIADAFKEPQRLLVRLVCMFAILAFGVYEGVRIDAHHVVQARAERDQWKAAHAKLMEDVKKADADAKEKLKGALAAKTAAEKAETAKPAAAPQPQRLRQPAKRPAAKGAGKNSGSCVLGIFCV